VAHAKQCKKRDSFPERLQTWGNMRPLPAWTRPRIAASTRPPWSRPPSSKQQRSKRARELLAQARTSTKARITFPASIAASCWQTGYGDLAESQDANKLATEIKNNPEWLQAPAIDGERLGRALSRLADSLLKRGRSATAE